MNFYDYDLRLNGIPVQFELSIVTEAGEGWKGREVIGYYRTHSELCEAIMKYECPLYWVFNIELQELEVK